MIRSAAWRALQVARRERPGLLMHYVPEGAPDEVAAADGYEIRAWQPGDEDAWVELMVASGAVGEWDLARLNRETRGLVRRAQFFAVWDRTLVAATGILDRPLRGRPALELAWVVRHPAHVGNQLGLAVITRALRAALALPGERPVYLYTDDHRLTAIAIYLDLGFAPDLSSHRSFRARWEAVFRALALRGRRRVAGSASPDGRGDAPGSPSGK